jgi:predicted Zn finger-like uncharacterized protein
MIVACPSCTTRFRVAEPELRPNGRRLRCGACGHIWRADAQGHPIPDKTAAAPTTPEPTLPDATLPSAALPIAPSPTPERLALPDLDLVFAPVRSDPAPRPMLDESRLPILPAERPPLPRLLPWIAWSGSAALALGLAASIYFHEVVAAGQAWTRPAYRLAQLLPEMSHAGIRLDDLRIEPDLKTLAVADAPAGLTASGRIVNETWIPRALNTLEMRIRDTRGTEFRRQDVMPARRWLWPGEAVTFRTDVSLDGVKPAEVILRLAPLE